MIRITQKTRIFVAISAVDFRKGIDGLAAECRYNLGHNPTSQSMFVFRNKSKTTIKILYYDGTGYWLCMKRLSQGKFWWPSGCGRKVSQMGSKALLSLILGEKPYSDNSMVWQKVG